MHVTVVKYKIFDPFLISNQIYIGNVQNFNSPRQKFPRLCIHTVLPQIVAWEFIFSSITLATKRNTVDGLNLCSFSHIKVFMEILLCCLGQKFSLFSIIKERRYNHGKTLTVLLNIMKMRKFTPVNLSPFTIGIFYQQKIHMLFIIYDASSEF